MLLYIFLGKSQISMAPLGAHWQLTARSAVIARGRPISYVFQEQQVVRSPIKIFLLQKSSEDTSTDIIHIDHHTELGEQRS